MPKTVTKIQNVRILTDGDITFGYVVTDDSGLTPGRQHPLVEKVNMTPAMKSALTTLRNWALGLAKAVANTAKKEVIRIESMVIDVQSKSVQFDYQVRSKSNPDIVGFPPHPAVKVADMTASVKSAGTALLNGLKTIAEDTEGPAF